MITSSTAKIFIRTALIAGAITGAAFAGTVSPDLRARNDDGTNIKVIVQYKANATAAEKSRSGGTKLADLETINGELRQMTVGAAKAAGATTPVSNVSAEHSVKSTATIT